MIVPLSTRNRYCASRCNTDFFRRYRLDLRRVFGYVPYRFAVDLQGARYNALIRAFLASNNGYFIIVYHKYMKHIFSPRVFLFIRHFSRRISERTRFLIVRATLRFVVFRRFVLIFPSVAHFFTRFRNQAMKTHRE